MDVRHENLSYWNPQANSRMRPATRLRGPASSPAAADIYPVNGIWVTLNPDFPIGANEACFNIRVSGVEAVVRKSIAEMLIFNENKRYDVKQNMQAVSTLSS